MARWTPSTEITLDIACVMRSLTFQRADSMTTDDRQSYAGNWTIRGDATWRRSASRLLQVRRPLVTQRANKRNEKHHVTSRVTTARRTGRTFTPGFWEYFLTIGADINHDIWPRLTQSSTLLAFSVTSVRITVLGRIALIRNCLPDCCCYRYTLHIRFTHPLFGDEHPFPLTVVCTR